MYMKKLGMKYLRQKLFCLNDKPDLFYGIVKFCNLGFYMEKCDNDGFLEKYCIL